MRKTSLHVCSQKMPKEHTGEEISKYTIKESRQQSVVIMWFRTTTCLAVLCFATYINAQSRCTTPNGETAYCISIYDCQTRAIRNQNARQILFLQESQCGYEAEPLVCCGSYSNYINRPTAPPRRPRPTRPTRPPTRPTRQRPTRRPEGTDVSNRNTLVPTRDICGFQDEIRILDGQVTDLNEFPWMALLQYKRPSGSLTFACGGTLISSRYILTAAHCVTGQILVKVDTLEKVRLGEWNTEDDTDCVTRNNMEYCNDPPIDVGIEKAIPHSGYSDTNIDRHDDIALIRMDQEVEPTVFIRPICSPLSNEKSNIGGQVIVAGWGRTDNANSSPVKLKLKIPIVDGSRCVQRFRSAGVSLWDKQLCADGERGRDSCKGDSGGPLITKTKNDSSQYFIEGVVSFGSRCGSEGWPGIYTKVYKYSDWIRQTMEP